MSNRGDTGRPVTMPPAHEQSHDQTQSAQPPKGAFNIGSVSLDSDSSRESTKQDGYQYGSSEKPSHPGGSHSWIASALQRPLIRRVCTSIVGETQTENVCQSRQPRTWRATWLRLGPLSGIFTMVLAIICLVASLGILAGSNGQLVEHWTAPPSTYLAIFTAIANLSLRYAAFHGVILAWWYRASKGSTLGQLHWDWSCGTTVRGALHALITQRHLGLLGLACLFSTLVVIDGPLLQRASTVKTVGDEYGEVPLNVSMAPEIPAGFTGIHYYQGATPVSYLSNETIITPTGNASNHVGTWDTSPLAAEVVQNWYHDRPLLVIGGCSGVCKATIKAPAMIQTSCRTESMAWNFGHLPRSLQNNANIAPPLDHIALGIGVSLVLTGDRESMIIVTIHGQSDKRHPGSANFDNCHGQIEMTTCALESGTAEYNVTIREGTMTLDTPDAPKYIAMANNTAVNRTDDPTLCPGCFTSTLGGIVWEMRDKFENIEAVFSAGDYLQAIAAGPALNLYEDYLQSNVRDCPKFSNPRSDVMKALNRLMVYWGAAAAKHTSSQFLDAGVDTETRVAGTYAGQHAIFHTDYAFFAAAAIVELICIVLVAPTYWKYWTIGRPVSFSPLEIAKAFESRMLDGCNSNSTGRDLARAFGDIHVKYGATSADESGGSTKIAFGDPAKVESPRSGSRLDI